MTTVVIKDIQIRRSFTAGYRPPTSGDLALKEGEEFVNFADNVRCIGRGDGTFVVSSMGPATVGPQGPVGPSGPAGAPGAAGTTDYLGLLNRPSVGTAAGTLAAGNDSRIVGAVQASALGAATFTATGAVASRNVADRASETANLLDYFQAGDADWTNAFTRALATGKPVEIPYNGGTPYLLSATYSLLAGAVIRGKGKRPTIKLNGTSSRLFTILTANVEIRDLIIDGSKAGLASQRVIQFDAGASGGVVQRVTLDNCTQGFGIYNGAQGCKILESTTNSSGFHGVVVDGLTTSGHVIRGCDFNNSVGFGVWFSNGSHRCEASFNRTYTNGLELIGITYLCHKIRVIGNHAEGTGDNGISCTGYDCTISGNTCIKNANNGIGIYGSLNSITGNVCKNNGQSFPTGGTSWSGIDFTPAFGGAAQKNCHSGNICCDDQAAPTQAYGVRHNLSAYPVWAAGVTVASGAYYSFGLNVYQSANSGTTGATSPTHTTGSVSDGAVTWAFIYAGPTSIHAYNNWGQAIAYGNRTANYLNATNTSTSVTAPGVVRIPLPDGQTGTSPQISTSYNIAPIGNITGNIGDLYLRPGSVSIHTSAYLKATSGNSTSWYPLMVRWADTTANRPSGLGSGFEGAPYWDITTRKPMYANGVSATWVDAQGRLDPITSITAAGTTQTDATQLSYAHNSISTVASGTGVKLPAGAVGWEMKVFNRGGNALLVYPPSGSGINALAVDAPFTIASGASATFAALTATVWAT